MEYRLNIALIGPREIPQNTGNIARTCAATGARLHLVGPWALPLRTSRSSAPGWITGTSWTLPTTTAKRNSLNGTLGQNSFTSPPRRRSPTAICSTQTALLVFGKETKGLPEELLKANHDRCVRLPMRGMIRSLNLSNAVAVGTYEVLRQWGYPALTSKGHLTKYHW